MFFRLLREPLLHFLLAGAVLFAIFGRGGSIAGGDDRQIVVSAADTDRMAAAFARTWNRPPDAEEQQAQIQDYIREEVLYRTALGMGLDKDDTIIRRRLRQKLEFLFEDTVAPPQDAELRAFYQSHQQKFRSEATISFRHIFISRRRGETAEADARLILARLLAGAPGAEDDGDAFALGEGFGLMPVDRIEAQFGEGFARELTQATPGRWAGPLRSAYGLHLVLIADRQPPALAPFEQVHAEVEREWFAEHRAAAQEKQYKTLLDRYKVTVQQRTDAP